MYRRRRLALVKTTLVIILPLLPAARGPLAQDAGRQTQQSAARPVETVLENITLNSGILALADSTVRGQLVTPPGKPATADSVEQQVQAVAASLGHGATWVKLLLPPSSIRLTGDSVAQYAIAQARLLGRKIGGTAPTGKVEIMGQAVASEKGQAIIAALGLKPVYLVTNPNSLALAGPLTPDQAQAYGAMDPASRQAMMEQMHEQMMQQAASLKTMMSQMTPGEQQQFNAILSNNGPGGPIFRVNIKTGPGGPPD